MCQGLPCVGTNVLLIQSLTGLDPRLKAGIRGVIEEEYPLAGEVLVRFPQQDFSFRLPEDVLSELGGNSPVGSSDPSLGGANPPTKGYV